MDGEIVADLLLEIIYNMASNETSLGISIGQQANFLKQVLGDWASQNQGIALIGADIDEKLWMGFQNTVGPKLIIVFLGSESGGSEDVKEVLDMEIRNWDVIISRGKMLTNPRNEALTNTVGPAKPFLDQVEECRDVIRSLELPTPMCLNPVVWNSIRPSNTDNWLIDSYIYNFSIWTRIGRIQTEAPQISTGPNLQLQDPNSGIAFNKSL